MKDDLRSDNPGDGRRFPRGEFNQVSRQEKSQFEKLIDDVRAAIPTGLTIPVEFTVNRGDVTATLTLDISGPAPKPEPVKPVEPAPLSTMGEPPTLSLEETQS